MGGRARGGEKERSGKGRSGGTRAGRAKWEARVGGRSSLAWIGSQNNSRAALVRYMRMCLCVARKRRSRVSSYAPYVCPPLLRCGPSVCCSLWGREAGACHPCFSAHGVI